MGAMSQAEVFTQPVDIPAPGRYLIIAEHSSAVIRTRHLFGLGPVRAALDVRDGHIMVAEPPRSSTVQVRFSVASFQSGNAARDAAVLSPRLLNAEAFPSMTFTSTELVPAHGRDDGAWSLRGELEVRGVTRPALARVTAVAADGATLRATAEVNIDRYDFGITAYRGLAARTLTVELGIVAHREAS
jgi:polyisoprenoid-binding protein YceI